MQIVKSNSQYIEKVLKDKNGNLVRARFWIYENSGRLKAKLVDFEYLDDPNRVILLRDVEKDYINFLENEVKFSLNNPYIVLVGIYSLGSKPRAPTFI